MLNDYQYRRIMAWLFPLCVGGGDVSAEKFHHGNRNRRADRKHMGMGVVMNVGAEERKTFQKQYK